MHAHTCTCIRMHTHAGVHTHLIIYMFKYNITSSWGVGGGGDKSDRKLPMYHWPFVFHANLIKIFTELIASGIIHYNSTCCIVLVLSMLCIHPDEYLWSSQDVTFLPASLSLGDQAINIYCCLCWLINNCTQLCIVSMQIRKHWFMESGVWKRRRRTNKKTTVEIEEEEKEKQNKKRKNNNPVWTEYGSWDHSVTIFDLYQKYKSDIYIFKPADFFLFFLCTVCPPGWPEGITSSLNFLSLNI